MKAKIYQASKPRAGEYVLEWRTDSMTAPAFNYFKTEAEARQAGMLTDMVIEKLKREVKAGGGAEQLKLYTIGFTKKTAEEFFNLLKDNKIEWLLDIRLNNNNQLAGFTKGDNLPYLLQEIAGIKYKHLIELAPTEELRKAYNGNKITWEEYKQEYKDILKTRQLDINKLIPGEAERACLLCSEPEAEQCHRSLAAEYLQQYIKGLTIEHL